MSVFSKSQPMARTPRVTARTPMLAKANQSSAPVASSPAATSSTSSASAATATATQSTPQSQTQTQSAGSVMTVSASGFAHSAQAQDAVASQTAATGSNGGEPAPSPEDLTDAALTSALRNDILDVVSYCIDMWRFQATFRNLTINAMSVTGGAGCLTGPRLIDLRSSAPGYFSTDGIEREIMDMCLRGISENFQLWQHYLFVPGLPLYPAFVAFPGPQAPPMPCVPTPLALFPSGQVSKITSAQNLARAINDNAPDDLGSDGLRAFVDNVAQCCAMGFVTFTSGQIVSGLMGHGPVPSFAPPMVPIGPVVGGSVISAPGCFAASSNFSAPRIPLG